MKNNIWSQIGIEEAFRQLGSSQETGLNIDQVKIRQGQGKNILAQGPAFNPLVLLLHQFTDTMVLVLLGATVLSGLIGAMEDAITIMVIVALNAILGFIQEFRAEKSLEAIKKLSAPFTTVLRGGNKIKIPASELVPGDVIFLETGDKVPADMRLIAAHNMEIDEAILTGESVPVTKEAEQIMDSAAPLAEMANMAFMGTALTKGRGMGLVTATGMDTVMGEIAHSIQSTRGGMTPLQIKLDQLGKILIVICILVCLVVVLLGLYRGEAAMTMLMAGISLAVAAIPEGLPAIVTVVLALGLQRMAKRQAIIRKLPAVETLGCTTVICSDKTGTLTQNKMTVKKLATLERLIDVSGDGYDLKGGFLSAGQSIIPIRDRAVNMIVMAAWHCNNSSLVHQGKKIETFGDPTEIALLVLARKAGIKSKSVRIKEIPFDSERKKMTVVIKEQGKYLVLMKGALEEVINSCQFVMQGEQAVPLDPLLRQKISNVQDQWAGQALRVLGFAYKNIPGPGADHLNDQEAESGLTLAGIAGLIDPPRPGVEKAIGECLAAGIIPVMVTGDHPVTAVAIARSIGLTESEQVITGVQIDQLTDGELYVQGVSSRVFARVSPQHKNRIVKVFQQQGHVVAMTGDGVNDAAAVKAADIGIAMGISGTEVTREASAMVLADDDFSTIISAVHEGRAIYDNIRKFLRYLLGGNIGEILVMLLASLMGTPLPLLPIQILWVNLITDGLPAIALGLEPAEPFIMQRKPRSKNENIFAQGLGQLVFKRGIYISVITLLAFSCGLMYCRWAGIDGLWIPRTMALSTLVFAQLFYVFECRSEKYSPFEIGFWANPYLLTAVIISSLMQLMVIHWEPLQSVFKTAPLEGWQWLIIIILTGSRLALKYIAFLFRKLRMWSLRYETEC